MADELERLIAHELGMALRTGRVNAHEIVATLSRLMTPYLGTGMCLACEQLRVALAQWAIAQHIGEVK